MRHGVRAVSLIAHSLIAVAVATWLIHRVVQRSYRR
jgi:hypothetical protein